MIADAQASTLAGTIEVQVFDWRRLAKYSFWIALFSIVSSVSAALANRRLLFGAPAGRHVRGVVDRGRSTLLVGRDRSQSRPNTALSERRLLLLGVLATAGAVYQLGLALKTGSGHFSLLWLLSCVLYAGVGLAVDSNLIWVFALVSLGGWMGAETGYRSGWGAYYLSMNYPLRFVLFGGLLTGAALALESHHHGQQFFRSTLIMGLLYLFIALWIMSIFGNYGNLREWERVRQIELFHRSILFGAVACGAIYHGCVMTTVSRMDSASPFSSSISILASSNGSGMACTRRFSARSLERASGTLATRLKPSGLWEDLATPQLPRPKRPLHRGRSIR